MIDAEQCVLHEQLDIQCFGYEAIDFPLTMRFRAGFEDVFEIRGLLREVKGKLFKPVWKDKCLVFLYEGGDKIPRSLAVHFYPLPAEIKGDTVQFHITLQAEREQADPRGSLAIAESEGEPNGVRADEHVPGSVTLSHASSPADEWLTRETEVRSDSLLLNRVMRRSLMDLHMLKTTIGGDEFFAAGVPWFVTLFGRDSLVTSLQTMASGPRPAADTLRLLARYQGTEVSDWRDEEPGKILHELRVGELARMNKIPHTPYYGTIDATPLFLILMSSYAHWTGDLNLFRELPVPHRAGAALDRPLWRCRSRRLCQLFEQHKQRPDQSRLEG